jgi:hypothetical protein
VSSLIHQRFYRLERRMRGTVTAPLAFHVWVVGPAQSVAPSGGIK